MVRKRVTREEQLEEMTRKLTEAQQKDPNRFDAHIAQLSFRILRLKKSMRIVDEDEQYRLIGLLMEHAYYLKTDVRDRTAAKDTFKKILQIHPDNQEANYRYAFLYYEERNWSAAIQYFQQATKMVDEDFRLSDDQIIKAHLFIGYCSTMLANESMKQAESLMGEGEAPSAQGISIEELTFKLKNMLASKEFMFMTKEEHTLISREEYEEFVEEIEDDVVLLDLTTNAYEVQFGGMSCELSLQQAFLLKKLLLAHSDGLSLADITGYQEESISESQEISWDNYRQMIRRLKQKLTRIGLSEGFITLGSIPRSYQIVDVNYSIVQYDAK